MWILGWTYRRSWKTSKRISRHTGGTHWLKKTKTDNSTLSKCTLISANSYLKNKFPPQCSEWNQICTGLLALGVSSTMLRLNILMKRKTRRFSSTKPHCDILLKVTVTESEYITLNLKTSKIYPNTISSCSIQRGWFWLFTPTFHYFYTDISVTFCSSGWQLSSALK